MVGYEVVALDFQNQLLFREHREGDHFRVEEVQVIAAASQILVKGYSDFTGRVRIGQTLIVHNDAGP